MYIVESGQCTHFKCHSLSACLAHLTQEVIIFCWVRSYCQGKGLLTAESADLILISDSSSLKPTFFQFTSSQEASSTVAMPQKPRHSFILCHFILNNIMKHSHDFWTPNMMDKTHKRSEKNVSRNTYMLFSRFNNLWCQKLGKYKTPLA